ncbi:MAG TPA: arsenic resistance N-acetyltransferase ArsN2 [Steroidobacteraceae bacterium]|nr:arsenic resistance N-acetyltransferase ArsN2 [Steroidobacteraceae bacterium]
MTATPALALRPSNRSDFEAVRALLSDAGLPTEDLASAPGLRFWVGEQGDLIVGAIGLEPYGAAGLLRSLAVATSYRAHGLGSLLVERLEREAHAAEIQVLVLLTQTAEPFFQRLGYEVIEREYVPEEVKHSAEFASLCPASAVCMTKTLAGRQPTEAR